MNTRNTFIIILMITLTFLVSAAAPVDRYIVNSSAGTVFDTTTTLTWQRETSGIFTFAEAEVECSTLTLDGTPGRWRVPTRKELETLVDFRASYPSIDTAAFPDIGTQSPAFWTSSAFAPEPNRRWTVTFDVGFIHAFTIIDNFRRLRCVR